jgi:DNA primase
MIPQEFIQSLLGRVDIVDVIDRYVKLKKAGANYQALCPFHNEKSPSFSVSPSKQFYHCFGCGEHGNAIGFLMEYSGLAYPEAIRQLAEQYGLEVPETRERYEKSAVAQAPGLAQRMNEALTYYRAELKKSKPAIDYLKGRGLTGEIAARYGMGYAPDGWQNLEAIWPDYPTADLKDTGLVIDSEPRAGNEQEAEKKSRRYDRFRNRVMFPILDSRGNVIGFGGRVIGAGEPKYLNSPETPLFEKGRELYGLFQARRAIRDANRVVVVEGYMDVVALAQHGVENAVATLGTATTPIHVGKLLKLADNVVFCFDGDSAGRKAAWRALEVSLPVIADGKLVSFLFLPPEDDPDTFVRREGKAAFEAAMDGARPLSQYLFAELSGQVDMASEEGRARFVAQARPLVTQVTAPALGAMIRKRLAELARLEAEELAVLVPGPTAAQSPASGRSRPAPARTVRRRLSHLDRLLSLLLQRPELVFRVPPDILPIDAEADALRAVMEFFAEDSERTQAQVEAYFRDSPHLAKIVERSQDPLLNQAHGPDMDLEADVDGLVARLREEQAAQRGEELLRLVESGSATPEQRAEYGRHMESLRAMKSGNPPAEERSEI